MPGTGTSWIQPSDKVGLDGGSPANGVRHQESGGGAAGWRWPSSALSSPRLPLTLAAAHPGACARYFPELSVDTASSLQLPDLCGVAFGETTTGPDFSPNDLATRGRTLAQSLGNSDFLEISES